MLLSAMGLNGYGTYKAVQGTDLRLLNHEVVQSHSQFLRPKLT